MTTDVAAAPRIEVAAVGVFEENCYLVVDPATRAAALIDPGDEGDRIVDMVRRADARLEAIWLTHAHLDHIGAIADVLAEWRVPVHLHPADLPVFEYAPRAALAYGLPFEPQPLPDRELAEGQVLSLGGLRFDVMHAPGHAPGHVVIHGHGIALAGDCLFYGSVGRTDLPLSDPRALSRSLQRIAALPPETVVYPGHGPSTTIGREVAMNPFLNGGARVLGG
ncbi:MAG: MBL fold metallo-hydrolase [Gemmatirosa sp.]|nr:MBL fold metallo-hydrolase [Gemmatirosa sp.]